MVVLFFCNFYTYPLDTGRKWNKHKTFRRYPWRLLNVLCRFNLHTVSRGYESKFLLFKSLMGKVNTIIDFHEKSRKYLKNDLKDIQ